MPSLQDFMAPDASFLANLRQQRKEAPEDFVAFELWVPGCGGGGRDRWTLAQQVAARVLHVTQAYRKAYLWHHEPFGVAVPPSSEQQQQQEEEGPLLRGKVRVGENVEDEWFVVWLLRLATADPELATLGLAAHVLDADGDFLLIEAALVAPDWLGPDNSQHRVWLQGGRFHFLSEAHHPLSQPPLTAPHALRLLASASASANGDTTAVPWLNAALDERLAMYPGAIEASKHRAACYVPLPVAVLLCEEPALVAAAIRTLRSRDPSELLGMMTKTGGGPSQESRTSSTSSSSSSTAGGHQRFAPRPLVPVQVTFTQYLFGQLESDELQPPKAFLTAIAEVETANGAGNDDEARARTQAAVARGVRVACGLEMLYARSKRGQVDQKKKQQPRIHEVIDSILQGPGAQEYTAQDFAASLAELPPDDDEAWLETAPADLDALLEKYGQVLTGQEDMLMEDEEASSDGEEEEEEEEEDGADLQAMVEGMKNFIGAMSGLEGAEVGRGGGRGGGPGDVSFDVNRLLNILKGRDLDKAMQAQGMLYDGSDEEEEEEEDADEEEDDRFEDEKEEEETPAGAASTGPRVYMREAKGMVADSDDEEEEGEGEDEDGMDAYMAQLEQELRGTTLDKTFERQPPVVVGGAGPKKGGGASNQGNEEEEEDLRPVDMDLNLVRNLLESMAAQGAAAGPATNLLGEMLGGGFGPRNE